LTKKPVAVVSVRLTTPARSVTGHSIAPRVPEPHEVEAARLPRDVYERLRSVMLTEDRWREDGGHRVCIIPVGSIVSHPKQACFILDAFPRSYDVSMDARGMLTIKYAVNRVALSSDTVQ
jgi:hypothetical protein